MTDENLKELESILDALGRRAEETAHATLAEFAPAALLEADGAIAAMAAAAFAAGYRDAVSHACFGCWGVNDGKLWIDREFEAASPDSKMH